MDNNETNVDPDTDIEPRWARAVARHIAFRWSFPFLSQRLLSSSEMSSIFQLHKPEAFQRGRLPRDAC